MESEADNGIVTAGGNVEVAFLEGGDRCKMWFVLKLGACKEQT
jgi:hypothetical protein